ncbi:hypothetical protein [Gemmiger formicilis]
MDNIENYSIKESCWICAFSALQQTKKPVTAFMSQAYGAGGRT